MHRQVSCRVNNVSSGIILQQAWRGLFRSGKAVLRQHHSRINPLRGIAQAHQPPRLSPGSSHGVNGTSSRIEQSPRDSARTQYVGGAIYGIAFSDSSHIDPQAGGAELNLTRVEKLYFFVTNALARL